ncbi:MAG: hypothetical protein WAN37_00555 [Bryobacteraceae bacterium]
MNYRLGVMTFARMLSKIEWVTPNNMSKMLGVEVQALDLIGATGPNYLSPQTAGETRFEIDAVILTSEVGDHKLCETNFG